MDLRPGAVIAGRYRVDRKVGSGGMGEVWSGDHLAIGTRVALKTMLSAAAVNHEIVARFRREAYLLGRIRSDYVARVVDFVTDDNFGLVLVMELVDGESLARVLTERVLSVEETVEIGCDLASALCDLHRAHIVHRDLKPGNVILSPMPDGHSRAVIVDFGVSRLLSAGDQDEETITGITRADMAVGTIEYMSPEQILNSRSVTGASDVYAVGAILFRALAGEHVFGDVTGETAIAQLKLTAEARELPLAQHDRVSDGLRSAVARALRRRPSDRFRSAEELLQAFSPLRDLVRAAALDLDSTTQDSSQALPFPKNREDQSDAPPLSAAYLTPSEPRVPAPPREEPRVTPASQADFAMEPAPERRSSLPLVGAVLLALVAGAATATLVLPRLALDRAKESAVPSASTIASAEPAPPTVVTADVVETAAAVASADPVPTASGSAPVDDTIFEVTGLDAGKPIGSPTAHPGARATAAPSPPPPTAASKPTAGTASPSGSSTAAGSPAPVEAPPASDSKF